MQLEKCPVCRARVKKISDPATPCRRCDSDLTKLHACYRLAERYRSRARRALFLGDSDSACRLARRALSLVDHLATRQTLAAALVASHRADLARRVLSSSKAARR